MDVALKQANFGVYFLCNDPKIDWAYSMLASFRRYNPTMPLTLIPYDQRIGKMRGLQEKFAFDILESDLYPEYQKLTLPVYDVLDPLMRKVAVFAGPYDHFLYLDTDIIVTGELTSLAQKVIESGADFVYFDTDINMVYRPGAFRDEMMKVHDARAFNSGTWFSRKGLFSLEQLQELTSQLIPIKPDLIPLKDQVLLNYYCDKSGAKRAFFADLMPDYFPETWYQHVEPQEVNGRWIQSTGPLAGRPVCMIHFAGQSGPKPSMPCYDVYLAFRASFEGWFQTLLWNMKAHLRTWLNTGIGNLKRALKRAAP